MSNATITAMRDFAEESTREGLPHRERVTQKERNANDKQWYKDKINLVSAAAYGSTFYYGYGGVTDWKRKKVNYDLFNNIINKADFEYVCQPYGAQVGDLPAQMTNRDIVSGKIKVLLGMEMSMPFSWNVIATNEQATTRKEQEEFGRIRQFVIDEIMSPIDAALKKQEQQAKTGRKLSPEEEQKLIEDLQAQRESQTPDEVRKYMVREHQDPAEVQAQEILNYLTQKEKLAQKFNKGFKHMCLSGTGVYRVDIINGEPCVVVVNPLYFDYDKSPDLDYIEDGEWARCEYRMTPSEVVANFGHEMTEDEIDRVYRFQDNWASPTLIDYNFTFDENSSANTVTVIHVTWKSLRKIGFLTFVDDKGELQEKIVDENYQLTKSQGDVEIEWEWIPEAHEGWKILDDIYVNCRPVPGQHKDLDNLYECKLPYYGASFDHINSRVTAPMDRMKSYQYYYDIILYRIELLMASDKGKILAANINAIPKSAGIDVTKFMYFMEANKIAFFNPNEEGNRGQGDVTNMVKEIDMSLASDIFKYIQMAEFIEKKCGLAIGVTPQMEAQIGPGDAVSNTRQNLVQASHIVRPYFDMHNNVKANVLQALIDKAKVAYATKQPRKLSYVLDDMSYRMLTIDPDMLDNSTFGIFVSNSSKAEDAKQAVIQLAQAALQNQQADLADIIKIIRSESINEAVEDLEAAQARKQVEANAAKREELQANKEAQAQQEKLKRDEWEHEKEMIILKEEERRKTELQKQAMLSIGFDPNKDEDEDQVPDVLEVYKFGVDADIKRKKLELDQAKLDQKTTHDAEKLRLEEKKIKEQAKKKDK
jgi:hypothetical protein